MAIDTKAQKDRRTLRFASLAEIRRDAQALVTAEAAGRLRLTGNWSLGRIFAHMAAWMSYPYDGFPARPAPWVLRAVLRLIRNKILTAPMAPGFRFRGVGEGTYGAEEVSTQEGWRRLDAALSRLERDPPTLSSPFLGELTHEQWKQLHARHAELHLSFAVVV